MARILSTILLMHLFYEFWFWFEFAKEQGSVPNFTIVAIHLVGILVLLGLVIPKIPEKIICQATVIWSAIFLIHGVINFQQFNFEGLLRSWAAPLILYSLFVSPVIYYALKGLKLHNKLLKSKL